MALDLVCIGDPTVDTFLKINDEHVALKVSPQHSQLQIDYAEKIPVDEIHRMPAGNCVNAAIAASRLGLHAALYGVTGADVDGRWIKEDLESEGVDSSLMAVDRARSTNSSTALVFRSERTLFVWHQPRVYHLPVLPDTAWVYATSVGPRGPQVVKLHKDLCAQLADRPVRLAFSPGTHQLRMGARALAPLLRRTDVLLLNREEAAGLTGLEGASPKDLLRALSCLGPRTCVVTDGIRGSFAYDGARFLRAGILDMPVVDRTGAGDAYGATLVTALLLGSCLESAMAWATVQSAFVVTVFGATPGLVSRRRLKSMVRDHPELVGKPF